MSTPAGTGALTALALRRDRIMLPGWLYALAAAVVGNSYSMGKLYGDQAQRAELARSSNASGPLRAMSGPVYDWSSAGALTVWKVGVIAAALAGLMSILMVVRHTRDEEESGRQEMLAATMVDRRAPLSAALSTVAAANAAIAAVLAVGLIAIGQGAAGSVAFGLEVAGGGMAFAGVAAVTAQLTAGARAAKGLAGAVLGVAFLLRAAGDAATADSSSPLVWISPLGWLEHLHPYAGESWWVLLPVAAFATLGFTTAYVLVARRDTGASFLPTHAGPARGAPSLRNPGALAWRLQRGALYGWASGLAVAGAVYGSVTNSVGNLVGGNSQVHEIFQRMGGHRGVTDAFVSSAMGVFGVMAGVFAVQSLLRLRTEETGQNAEALLALPVGRLRWAASHLAHAVLGPVVLLASAGAVMGLAYGLSIHDVGGQLPRLIGAAVAQAPAVWVLVGLGTLLYGLLPKAAASAWGLLAAFVMLGQFGSVLRLPQAVMDLSPFTHLPKLPGDGLSPTPFCWLIAVAAVTTGVGLAGLRRRDLTS